MKFRYALAGGMVLLGLVLLAQGVVSTPRVTSVECTGSSSADAETPSATPECTRTTERAWGQQLYIVGLGAAIAALGVGIVVTDRKLAERTRR